MKICVLILSLLLAQVANAQEQLIFAIDVIRHGDRTPIEDINTPTYQWPQGLGELTSTGMQQEYELGEKLHHLYINQYHLLPTSYTDSTIYIYSTDYGRTFISAQLLSEGLYPTSSIPIHTNSLLFTPLLDSGRAHFLEQTIFSSRHWLEQEQALAPNFPAWSEATGVHMNSPFDLIIVGDALYVRRLHHVPINLSARTTSTIINTGFSVFAQLYQPHRIGHDVAHRLLVQIDQYLLLASQNQIPLKYVLFSAHDVTILGLMSDLYAPLSGQVPYASDVKFMLFKTTQNHYEVKVTYNDQAVNIPGCTGNVCTLKEFLKIDN